MAITGEQALCSLWCDSNPLTFNLNPYLESCMKDLILSLYLAVLQLVILVINCFILVFNAVSWFVLTSIIVVLKVFLQLFDKENK